MNKPAFLLTAFLCCCQILFAQKTVTTLQVPGAAEFCKIDSAGYSVLPSGRYVTPAGKTVQITRSPFGLDISPDGRQALVLHSGVVSLINLQSPEQVVRIPDHDGTIPPIMEGSSFLGVAFSKDAKTAWLSGGGNGTVVVFDVANKRKSAVIFLDGPFGGKKYEDSFTSDLTLDEKRNQLLVLDRGNNRLVKIDLASQTIAASIPVGRIPFGVAVSPDHSTAFVANAGLFEYPLVPGLTPENYQTMGLEVPAYGYPSKEAEEGVVYPDGRKIPGLGSPLDEKAMSVWTIDLDKNTVTAKFKTGYQIGDMFENEEEEEGEIVGGSHPNSVAVGSRLAYISNAQNDLISVLDYKTGKITAEIPLTIHPKLDAYRGLMPFGLTLSPDEKTLYIACLSLNAVAVVDVENRKVKGYLPTGWMPTRVVCSPDGSKLYITSARGYGAGPNGGTGFTAPPQGTYIGDIQLGTFQIVDVPDETALAAYTQQVLRNTFHEIKIRDDRKNPLPPLPGLRKSPIRHIVYVTKENRTYDEVFGQLPQAKGDASLARYGVGVEVPADENGAPALSAVKVMPNHLKIAQQWAFSDNFYCDSDASIHGHKWMVGTIPNEYVEANSQVNAEFKPFSSAPGRRFPRTTGATDPEDYNERGGIWENLAREEITFYNFGEANEYTAPSEEKFDTLFGARHSAVFPMPKPLFDRTSFTYPGYNTNVPDQFRMDKFEEEFTRKWLSLPPGPSEGGGDGTPPPSEGAGGRLPQLLTIILPNDHGAGPRPEEGYPYLHSYMADNDLALGRLLHFLSRTPYWKNMLVIVTEDDPQGGVDHLDAHRSVLMLAGPYVKRGYVSHTHANFGSLLKMMYTLLDAPFVNQYDLTASLLQDFFTDKPDFTPFDLEPSDTRIFDPQKAMDVYHKTFDWEKIKQGPKMDDEGQQRQEFYKQHKGN